SNKWHTSFTPGPNLSYLRPPRILGANVPPQSKSKLVKVIAEVRSTLPLESSKVEARINGQPVEVLKLDPSPGDLWTVQFEAVLAEGVNRIRLWATNAEGKTGRPGEWPVQYKAAQPPPRLSYLEPKNSGDSEVHDKVFRPTYTVRFRVQSQSKLKRVALVHDPHQEGKSERFPVDVKKFDPVKGELVASVTLQLKPGQNLVNIMAENDHGVAPAPKLVVNFQPPRVRVVVDQFESRDAKGPPVKKTEAADGTVPFDAVKDA